MVSADAARTFVGVIGNVISFCLFLSPAPTFWKIWKQKSVEQYKPDPYLATVLNCAMWVFYGLPIVHPDSLLVITINSIGLFIEFCYVGIFLFCSTKEQCKKIFYILLGELIFFLIIVAITLKCFHGTTSRSMIIGIICIVFNVIMYASPLTVMRRVIRTKSVKYMPFYLSLANFCNGVVWLIYALIKFDIYIAIPNGLGALSGLVQLILYGAYYNSTPKDDDIKTSDVEMA